MTNAEKLAQLEAKQREIADEMEKLKKQMENKTWHGLKDGDVFYRVRISTSGAYVHNSIYHVGMQLDTGFEFTSESETQRMADMLNYVGLVRRKALEMGGFRGYTYNINCETFVLCYRLGHLGYMRSTLYCEGVPLHALLTEECAEALVNDPEIIAAAKLAWGVI